MSRGSCFGSCPVYTVTIHGNGTAEYSGEQGVNIKGNRSTAINSSQIKQLLSQLDHINFFSLEDTAFEKCNDTPSVAVSVSLDGRSKRVISDAYCVGAPLGPQAQLVSLTRQIDKAIGSEAWVY
jgi:hypothetical protein